MANGECVIQALAARRVERRGSSLRPMGSAYAVWKDGGDRIVEMNDPRARRRLLYVIISRNDCGRRGRRNLGRVSSLLSSSSSSSALLSMSGRGRRR